MPGLALFPFDLAASIGRWELGERVGLAHEDEQAAADTSLSSRCASAFRA